MRMTRYVRKSLQIRSNKASPRSILAWRQTYGGRRPDLRRTPSTTEAPRFGWGIEARWKNGSTSALCRRCIKINKDIYLDCLLH